VASVYKTAELRFASDFFPDTPWDKIRDALIRCSVREGEASTQVSVRKPTTRWRGNPARKDRPVRYIDLRRIQPIAAQVGYSRLAKPQYSESKSEPFDEERLARLSSIIGKSYIKAEFSLSDADDKRWVPVVKSEEGRYSGFHQGAGEVTLANLLREDMPKYGVVLIDELETSLHPRSQRRLVRELAEMARVREIQIIVTTHSPYVLEELPPAGRLYVMNTSGGKKLLPGVSPYFAMTQMDDEKHPEVDIYVEDEQSKILLEELLVVGKKELLLRCKTIPFGAAGVGKALGTMVASKKFPRPSLVFLDGDQEESQGCLLLPGDDAPERVVFEGLQEKGWQQVSQMIARSHSDLVDAAESAMALSNHHDWIKATADRVVVGGHELWRAMASAWVAHCAKKRAQKIADAVEEALDQP